MSRISASLTIPWNSYCRNESRLAWLHLPLSILGDRNTATNGQDRSFCRGTLVFRSRGFWEEGGTKRGPGMRRKRTRRCYIFIVPLCQRPLPTQNRSLDASDRCARNGSALLINLTGLNDPKNTRFHSDAARSRCVWTGNTKVFREETGGREMLLVERCTWNFVWITTV